MIAYLLKHLFGINLRYDPEVEELRIHTYIHAQLHGCAWDTCDICHLDWSRTDSDTGS